MIYFYLCDRKNYFSKAYFYKTMIEYPRKLMNFEGSLTIFTIRDLQYIYTHNKVEYKQSKSIKHISIVDNWIEHRFHTLYI